MEEFGSIAETGATAGDKVKCISVGDALRGVRYNPGDIYVVHMANGKPVVHGNGHGKNCGAGIWTIPFAGFGATWRKE